ncbi:MAG: hypothetical protein ACJ8JD_03110 [Chthoniobacterales bacterium]
MIQSRRRKDGVTALLLTHDLPDEAVQRFIRIRRLVDEFVVFVDAGSDAEATAKRARIFATQVSEVSTNGIPEIRQEMISACPTDWILKIDSDEDVSREWECGAWRDLLDIPEMTHFIVARRWLLPQGGFLAQPPWWPDPQIRLFKRDEAHCPVALHQPLAVRGPAAFCRNLAIHHYALFQSRAEREAKVRRYQRHRGTDALAYFYLAEDYNLSPRRVPPAMCSASSKVPLEMNVLEPSECRSISIIAESLPPTMQRDQLQWVEVTIRNNSHREISCGLPFPINIAYHWFEARSGKIVIFDGMRSHLFPAIAPNSSRACKAMIFAPPTPGIYRLQIDLVQEGVRWFHEIEPRLSVVEAEVEVS